MAPRARRPAPAGEGLVPLPDFQGGTGLNPQRDFPKGEAEFLLLNRGFGLRRLTMGYQHGRIRLPDSIGCYSSVPFPAAPDKPEPPLQDCQFVCRDGWSAIHCSAAATVIRSASCRSPNVVDVRHLPAVTQERPAEQSRVKTSILTGVLPHRRLH